MADREPADHWSDAELIRRANQGDEQAFMRLCVSSIPSLRRFMHYQCRTYDVPIDLADDFCQQAIVNAVDQIADCTEHQHRAHPHVSFAWLKMIALNALRDWRRKQARMQYVEVVETEARPTVSIDELEEYEEILKYFSWLGDDERDMLELVLVEGKPIVEAGATLGLKDWAAYKCYERGLERLRDLIAEHSKRAAAGATSR